MPLPFTGAFDQLSSRLLPDFEGAERGSHQEIDREYAEVFFHYVVINRPNFQAQPDPLVPPQTVRVTFFWEAAEQRLGMSEERVQTRVPKIAADRNLFRNLPKRGDRFLRGKDRTSWEVTKAEPDGLSGLLLHLVQLGVPA